MTTAQIIIICLTVLALALLVAKTYLDRDKARAQLQREVAMHERATTGPTQELADATRALVEAAEVLSREALATRRHAGPPRGPSIFGASVVATTRKPDDQSVRGIVHAVYADKIVLRDAAYLKEATTEGGKPSEQPAKGFVHIELPLSTLQELAPAPSDPSLVA